MLPHQQPSHADIQHGHCGTGADSEGPAHARCRTCSQAYVSYETPSRAGTGASSSIEAAACKGQGCQCSEHAEGWHGHGDGGCMPARCGPNKGLVRLAESLRAGVRTLVFIIATLAARLLRCSHASLQSRFRHGDGVHVPQGMHCAIARGSVHGVQQWQRGCRSASAVARPVPAAAARAAAGSSHRGRNRETRAKRPHNCNSIVCHSQQHLGREMSLEGLALSVIQFVVGHAARRVNLLRQEISISVSTQHRSMFLYPTNAPKTEAPDFSTAV